MGEHLPVSPGNSVASIRVVTGLYAKMLNSPRLQRHFAGVSMEGLISKQTAFIDVITSNGTSYTQDDLHQAHAHLGIDGAEFDEMLLLLDIALREQRIDPELGDAIKRVFASYRDEIVNQEDDSKSGPRRPESSVGHPA